MGKIILSTATTDDIADVDKTVFTNEILYLLTSTSYEAAAHNLLISGVSSLAECYKICLILNGGSICNLFR